MAKNKIKTINATEKFNSTNRNINGFSGIYLGFVISNYDAQKMGRLSVWIPSINSDKTQGTFEVSYLSPYAGASNLSEGAQTSYGFWAIPSVNDEVVISFINGDPNKGIWMGCLYQQFMNNMIPGIASSKLEDGKTIAPSKEYNKSGKYASTSMDPLRPAYDDLKNGLTNQGLMSDNIRGQTTASARRSNEPDVIGLLSPGGSQFVMDDNSDDKFIRLRTSGGAQILINDTIGMIYAITKNGNSWVELSDDGIDVYTAKTMSFRSQQDMNFHSDGNINFFSVNNINMVSKFNTSISSGTNLNIIAGGTMSSESNGMMSIISGSDFNMRADGNIGLDSGSSIALRGCGDIGISGCGSIQLKGSKILQNSGNVITPGSTNSPTGPTLASKIDRELNLTDGFAELKTMTIVSRLPTHEPYSGHPTSSTDVASQAINLNVSSKVDTGNKSTSTSTTISSGIQNNTTDSMPSKTINWWIPVSGIVNNIYSSSSNFPGVDIKSPKNNTVIATRSGKIVWASEAGSGSVYNGYGICVVIDHLDGYYSVYGYLNKVSVEVNDSVSQGQTIGFVGSSGVSTTTQCHFEIRQNGNRINPSVFITSFAKKGTIVTSGKQK